MLLQIVMVVIKDSREVYFLRLYDLAEPEYSAQTQQRWLQYTLQTNPLRGSTIRILVSGY